MHWFCVRLFGQRMCFCMCICLWILYLALDFLFTQFRWRWANDCATECVRMRFLFTVSLSPFNIIYDFRQRSTYILFHFLLNFVTPFYWIHPTCCSKCWIILYSLGFFLLLLFFINAEACFVSVSTVYFVFYFSYCWTDDYLQVWLTNPYTYAVDSVHHMEASPLGREREWVWLPKMD